MQLLPSVSFWLLLALASLNIIIIFLLFRGHFLIFASTPKVGRHCCRWHSLQEKEMPQQQKQKQ